MPALLYPPTCLKNSAIYGYVITRNAGYNLVPAGVIQAVTSFTHASSRRLEANGWDVETAVSWERIFENEEKRRIRKHVCVLLDDLLFFLFVLRGKREPRKEYRRHTREHIFNPKTGPSIVFPRLLLSQRTKISKRRCFPFSFGFLSTLYLHESVHVVCTRGLEFQSTFMHALLHVPSKASMKNRKRGKVQIMPNFLASKWDAAVSVWTDARTKWQRY